jgi:AraC-like DNA-binding protein
VINLLVCRLHRRIDPNRTTRALLQALAPATKREAGRVAPVLGLDLESAQRDVESVVIEKLLEYQPGLVSHPLHYLFGRFGALRAHYELSRRRAREARHVSDASLIHHAAPDPSPELWNEMERAARFMTTVRDGETLSLLEFRIFHFCATNPGAGGRPNAGLHLWLAQHLGMSRSVVTRIFNDAERALIEACGESPKYLARHGLRKQAPRGVYRTGLDADTIVAILRDRRDTGASHPLLAHAYGTTEHIIRAICSRWGNADPEAVRRLLSRRRTP